MLLSTSTCLFLGLLQSGFSQKNELADSSPRGNFSTVVYI